MNCQTGGLDGFGQHPVTQRCHRIVLQHRATVGINLRVFQAGRANLNLILNDDVIDRIQLEGATHGQRVTAAGRHVRYLDAAAVDLQVVQHHGLTGLIAGANSHIARACGGMTARIATDDDFSQPIGQSQEIAVGNFQPSSVCIGWVPHFVAQSQIGRAHGQGSTSGLHRSRSTQEINLIGFYQQIAFARNTASLHRQGMVEDDLRCA